MWCVYDDLGVGDVMDGGDGAVFDAELLLNDFDHGSDAVGGA